MNEHKGNNDMSFASLAPSVPSNSNSVQNSVQDSVQDSIINNIMKCGKCAQDCPKKDAVKTNCFHYFCLKCVVESDLTHCPRCKKPVQEYVRCYNDNVFTCRYKD